jgi:hydroxymethylbilane synthase
MRLKLASRKSDLARWQAVQMGRAFEALGERPTIEYIFKASLGDQNLDLPLAGMGAKGVFTEDFYQDLTAGHCDLVVHSWKDLPVDERPDTCIAMTLPRADTRDLLLVPHRTWDEACQRGELTILTSSPRRVYNLTHSLGALLPRPLELRFVNVRGNVPTRVTKMFEQNCALIVAKAGLDRLLQAEQEGFLEAGLHLRAQVNKCHFMVLPTRLNPGAPAQGALAVEISRRNEGLAELCRRLNDAPTFISVSEERRILAGYGGGCHQKIGVTILTRDYGKVIALRGLTDQGEVLERWALENATPWARARRREDVFPHRATDNSWFTRKSLSTSVDLTSRALFVARAEAVPDHLQIGTHQLVWTAGLQTWRRLAEKGIWVNGSSEGLGESERPALDALVGPVAWTKLSHQEGHSSPGMELVPTYRLEPKAETPDLRGKTHFFWLSTTAFERARQLFPNEILNGYNAAGPGSTYDWLSRQSGLKHAPKAFIGLEQFLAETVP